ncbi:MAG: hypothetical protein KTR25_09405 [Myxococcales bacterium]|nr:hypothetical protein [Myxococcales bacterium]
MSVPDQFESSLWALARTRTFLSVAALHIVTAIVLMNIPLLNGLGFERALTTAVLSSVTTPLVAIAGFHRQQTRSQGLPVHWWASAIFLCVALLIPSLVAGAVFEMWTQPCDVELGLQFFVLLGGGNVLVTASISMAAFYWTPSRYRSAILATAITIIVLLIWFGFGLWRLYNEPQIFVYLAPLGFWPGSIYDESLPVPLALWVFRGYSTLLSLSLVCWIQASLRFRPTWLVLSLLGSALTTWLYLDGGQLGFRFDRAYIQSQLSQKFRTPHFILYASPAFSRSAIKALAREHEFRFEQLASYFGVEPPSPIHSYVYRNAQEKGQLMGAYQTQIARPWHQEIHIHGAYIPHSTLKHELAHIFAGQLAAPPFRIPMLWGVVPNMGLIEGIAVAADWPIRELTVHEWAAAMKRLERLPSIAQSLDPTGFWSISSSRAYTATGSFVAWLVRRYGMKKFSEVYSGKSFLSTYGVSTSDLEDTWRYFLDSITLDPPALRMAEHRFARPSIFEKVCARTTSTLAQQVSQHLRSRRLTSAQKLIEQILQFQPADPRYLTQLAWTYLQANNLPLAEQFASRAHNLTGTTEKAKAAAQEVMGHIAWSRGEVDQAAQQFTQVFNLHLSTSSVRLQSVRLAALTRPPDIQNALRDYLERRLTGGKDLMTLTDLHHTYPKDPLIGYLLARRLEAIKAPQRALATLPPPTALPTQALQDEAVLLKGRLTWAAGKYSSAAQAFRQATEAAHRQSTREEAITWEQRSLHALHWE